MKRWTLALGLAAATASPSCSSEQAQPPLHMSAGGASASSSTSATATTSTTTSGGGGAGGEKGGCLGWPGWEAWDDYAADEPFCVPASKDALPPPIVWEPCDSKAGISVGCRQMSISWKWKNSPIAFRYTADVAPDRRVLLEFVRVALEEASPYSMRIVAEADGPVHSAFLDPRGKGDKAYLLAVADHGGGVRDGRTVFRLRSGANLDYFPEAIIGGDIDDLHPKVLHSWESSQGHDIQASSMLWAAYAPWKIELAKWDEPLTTVSSGGPEQFNLSLHEDKAVWVAGSHVNGADIRAYDPSSGLVTLIPKPAPYNGVFGPGTDGVHLVWVRKTGKAQPSDPYTTADIMVSPFTTDPAALQPKRLRSYPTLPYVRGPAVLGCGYAGYTYDPGHVLIVRIADGYWWELPSSNCDPPDFSDDFCWGALAISCDEIFLGGGRGIAANIHRVELSALGDPNPPD